MSEENLEVCSNCGGSGFTSTEWTVDCNVGCMGCEECGDLCGECCGSGIDPNVDYLYIEREFDDENENFEV